MYAVLQDQYQSAIIASSSHECDCMFSEMGDIFMTTSKQSLPTAILERKQCSSHCMQERREQGGNQGWMKGGGNQPHSRLSPHHDDLLLIIVMWGESLGTRLGGNEACKVLIVSLAKLVSTTLQLNYYSNYMTYMAEAHQSYLLNTFLMSRPS